MSIPHDKPALRRLMRSRLAALSQAEKESCSERIRMSLRKLLGAPSPLSPPSREGKVGILGFLSLPTEPDLLPLYRELQLSGIVVAVPRTEGDQIIPVELPRDTSGLRKGPHGVLEPEGSNPGLPLSGLSLVLCPGLAFSASGARLGRGGGHFDRFLAASKIPAWGVAFDLQVMDKIPTEPWDRGMDRVITEQRTLSQPPTTSSGR